MINDDQNDQKRRGPSLLGLPPPGLRLAALAARARSSALAADSGACLAVRLGLAAASGLDLPLLPIDTLLCLAQATPVEHTRVVAMLDARMGQVYAGAYERHDKGWVTLTPAMLCQPQDWVSPAAWQGLPVVLAGNALAVHGIHLQPLLQACQTEPVTVWPQASDMLVLAKSAWLRGEGVAAQDALPAYVRDEVARTTAERLADKSANA
jgi:tRNA threonylcarbamoyladenosine biosynthesis protein TsaB